MTQQSYEARQVVRPLGRRESIPNLCTACLLIQQVKPFGLYEPDPEPDTRKKYTYSEERKRDHYKRRKSDQDFAPHIETIKRMRAEGKTFIEIAEAIGKKRQTLNGYCWRNKEMFE